MFVYVLLFAVAFLCAFYQHKVGVCVIPVMLFKNCLECLFLVLAIEEDICSIIRERLLLEEKNVHGNKNK